MSDAGQRQDVMGIADQVKAAAADMIRHNRDASGSTKHSERTAILFTGNIQHNIPHSILFSQDIGATEKVVYQVMKGMLQSDRIASEAPRRKEIAAAVPCTEPTVTKSRTALRVNRLLTFCQRVRERGRVIGDIYMMHETPLPMLETLTIDPEYGLFLEDVLSHKKLHAKNTLNQAKKQLDEMTELNNENEQTVLEHMQEVITGRDNGHYSKNFTVVEKAPETDKSKNFTVVEKAPETDKSKNFTVVEKAPETDKSKNFTHSSCCSSSNNINISIAHTRDEDLVDLNTLNTLFAAHFPQFKESRYLDEMAFLFFERRFCLPIIRENLEKLEPDSANNVMYQLVARLWRTRIGSPPVYNIIGYTVNLVEKHQNQTFNLDDYGHQVKQAVEEDDPSHLVGLHPRWNEL